MPSDIGYRLQHCAAVTVGLAFTLVVAGCMDSRTLPVHGVVYFTDDVDPAVQLHGYTVTFESLDHEGLYPPAYTTSRQAIEEVEIGGYRIPRGSQVQLPLFLTHRDIRWFDRRDDFVPHRFQGDGEEHFPRTA